MRWKKTEYTGWGRVLKATGDLARPERISALRATSKERPSPAIGNRRSYGDAPLNNGGYAIDMTRLDRLISFDAESGILRAEAGIEIGEIARIFAPIGWLPAVMPGTGFATLGGCIANDVHGKNHHGAGSFGTHVTEIELLGVKGRLRRITAENNHDIFRATLGGLGQTGVIVAASIRLIPCVSDMMDVTETRAETLEEFMALLIHSSATYCVGWIDAAARGASMGRGILEEAEIGQTPAPAKTARVKSVPFNAPSFFLSPPVVRAFNFCYLRRVPAEGRRVARPMSDFFFPLDRIHNWNRLYGKPGFHQFQCVLPTDAAPDALARMMELISSSGLASPLAVLKRLGEGRAGMMSFPMEGFTLAVDFPNRAKATVLISELEAMTESAGGRVYLAKDSLATPEMIEAMYDERDAFATIANEIDPERHFETDMVRRLDLRGSGA